MAITVTAQLDDILQRYKDFPSRAAALAWLQECFDTESRRMRLTNDSEDVAMVAGTRVYSLDSNIVRIWDSGLVYDAETAEPVKGESVRRWESGGYVPRQVARGTPGNAYLEMSAAGLKQLGMRPPPDTSSLVVSGATNATPIVVTTSAAHGLSDSSPVYIQGVLGNTAANGSYYAKVTGYSATTFGLYSDAALTTAVAGSGAYTSGGLVATITRPFLRLWVTRTVTLVESSPSAGQISSLPDIIESRDFLSSAVWIKHARRRHPEDLQEHLELFKMERAKMSEVVTSLFPDVKPRWEPAMRAAARPVGE